MLRSTASPLYWRLAFILHRGGREDSGGGKWRIGRQREVGPGQVRVQVGACQHGDQGRVRGGHQGPGRDGDQGSRDLCEVERLGNVDLPRSQLRSKEFPWK